MPTDISVAYSDENNTILEFIGRVDKEGYAVGPFWVSGGYAETAQFTNGFFYGPLDEVGKMTGKHFISYC